MKTLREQTLNTPRVARRDKRRKGALTGPAPGAGALSVVPGAGAGDGNGDGAEFATSPTSPGRGTPSPLPFAAGGEAVESSSRAGGAAGGGLDDLLASGQELMARLTGEGVRPLSLSLSLSLSPSRLSSSSLQANAPVTLAVRRRPLQLIPLDRVARRAPPHPPSGPPRRLIGLARSPSIFSVSDRRQDTQRRPRGRRRGRHERHDDARRSARASSRAVRLDLGAAPGLELDLERRCSGPSTAPRARLWHGPRRREQWRQRTVRRAARARELVRDRAARRRG